MALRFSTYIQSLELLQLRKPVSYLQCSICFSYLYPQGLLKVSPIAMTSSECIDTPTKATKAWQDHHKVGSYSCRIRY